AKRISLNVTGGDSAGAPSLKSPEDAINLMQDGERQMVLSDSGRASYRALLTDIANSRGVQMFHCSAGKDRTGWGTATLLSILGVPRAPIVHDSLLSNDSRSPPTAAPLAAMPAAAQPIYAPLLGVSKSFLQAGFDQVDETYGSMDAYATKGLHLSAKTI